MWVYHRSGVETDWECPRRHFWNHHFGGRGVTPIGVSQPLTIGTIVHEAADALLKGEDLDSLIPTINTKVRTLHVPQECLDPGEFHYEQAMLVGGMLRGFALKMLPLILREYEPIRFEKEAYYEHPSNPELVFVCRPDVIMRHRDRGTYVYVEWKTVSNPSLSWLLSWGRAIQLHAGAFAASAMYDLPVTECLVIGFDKGRFQEGWQRSPWCYHWRKRSTGEIFPTYKSGWERTANWKVEGVYDPLEHLPHDDVLGLYPMTQPISVHEGLVQDFFAAQQVRQHEIQDALLVSNEVEFNRVFPRHTNKCIPAFGRSCEYEKCCFTQIGEDPVGSGLYAWRTPHHPLEAKARGIDVVAPTTEET